MKAAAGTTATAQAASAYGPEVMLDGPAYIHPSACLYGRVSLARGASIWPQAVLRAECAAIEIGPYSNLQDGVVAHVGAGGGTTVGAYCSIAHQAVIHAARIGDNCLIGIHATVMDGCVVGENSVVAGGAFLTEGTVVPANSIAMGVPAKVVASRNNWVANRFNALLYHRNALAYARGEHRAWDGPDYERFVVDTLERLNAEFAALEGRSEVTEG